MFGEILCRPSFGKSFVEAGDHFNPSEKKVMDLKKQDKIRHTIHTDGSVVLSRKNRSGEDPVPAEFLTFLAHDIKRNPQNVKAVDPGLPDRIRNLTAGVAVDMESPLPTVSG
ncbi:hypothetical protein EPICR_150039 [Candidatus Desulfarcum epimagneticum]|uniref:Uncharacterized protein n=1 Tax=uncultured Desulfobacteraceae bacterium TaxID=218296 RepID=A0A484HIA9_9BACT|nr:hypothetical protein EPICR_150039 [uncultured Desulfobacteraceae bacterium]